MLLYFITTVTSQVHSARHHQRVGNSALPSVYFRFIDDMLLRLYYLYEKSPKKCRKLQDIINDLSECFDFDDKGVRPLRSSGSRWVGHKLSAMKRVVAKFGAYSAHIGALCQDTTVRADDRAKLKGYTKWVDAKYLSALFIDYGTLNIPKVMFKEPILLQEEECNGIKWTKTKLGSNQSEAS